VAGNHHPQGHRVVRCTAGRVPAFSAQRGGVRGHGGDVHGSVPRRTSPERLWDRVDTARHALAEKGALGAAGPLDLMICATAVHHGLVVLHEDADFVTVARVLPDVSERNVRNAPGLWCRDRKGPPARDARRGTPSAFGRGYPHAALSHHPSTSSTRAMFRLAMLPHSLNGVGVPPSPDTASNSPNPPSHAISTPRPSSAVVSLGGRRSPGTDNRRRCRGN
jgi:hypothetical protein